MKFHEWEVRTQLNSLYLMVRRKKALAAHLGISTQYLRDVVNGKMPISKNLAEKLGFTRVVTFERHYEPAFATILLRFSIMHPELFEMKET